MYNIANFNTLPLLPYLDQLDTSTYQSNPSRTELQHLIRNLLHPSLIQHLQSNKDLLKSLFHLWVLLMILILIPR